MYIPEQTSTRKLEKQLLEGTQIEELLHFLNAGYATDDYLTDHTGGLLTSVHL